MTLPKMIQIYKNKQLSGDAGTDTFVLPRNDMVLEYLLQVRSKNGATANAPDAVAMPTVESAVSKIEVKSGGTIFKSFNAEMCRKIATYRNGFLPPTLHTQDAGTTYAGNEDPELGWQVYDMPINFNLKQDPGELNDLGKQYPDKRIAMIKRWEQYKIENKVLDISLDLSGHK